jgi:group I intron endonuclease
MNEIISEKSGIYKIVNGITGDFYIGQASCLRKRKNHHWHKLRNGVHHNSHLQNAWNKYGEDNFCFYIILVCNAENLTYYEQLFVDTFCPRYNICKECVNSSIGIKRTDEFRRRLSEQTKKYSEEISKRNSQRIGEKNWNFGKHKSEETKRKLSESGKGKHWHEVSSEARERISKSHIGKKASEETKRKMSESKRRRREKPNIVDIVIPC